MGASISYGRCGSAVYRPPWAQKYRETSKAYKVGRRRFTGRKSATSRRDGVPKKLAGLGFGRRAKSAQKTLAIRGLRQEYKFDTLLEVAHLAHATYYYHEKRLTKSDKYSRAKEQITAIYHENKGRYGYRRITAELRHRLSPILDLCCRDIVSYAICDHPVLSVVTSMLKKAFAKIPDGTDLILHSDQGWQYQHKRYQQMPEGKGIRQSMSRKGNCLDNAVIENFFGLLKSELLYLQEFTSMEHFKSELIDYLDYYNNRRIKAKLKGLPSALHRQQALSAA